MFFIVNCIVLAESVPLAWVLLNKEITWLCHLLFIKTRFRLRLYSIYCFFSKPMINSPSSLWSCCIKKKQGLIRDNRTFFPVVFMKPQNLPLVTVYRYQIGPVPSFYQRRPTPVVKTNWLEMKYQTEFLSHLL